MNRFLAPTIEMIQSISQIGVTKAIDPFLQRRIALVNIISASISFICLFYGLFFYFLGSTHLAFGTFAVLAMFPCVVLFNKRQQFTLSRLIFCIGSNLVIFVFASLLGRESAIQYWLMTLCGLPFVCCLLRERLLVFIGLLSPFLAYVFLEITEYSLFGPAIFTTGTTSLIGLFMVPSIMAVLVVQTGFFAIFSDRLNIDLAEAKNRLATTAHRAGQAEVATSILHNVGNVLNSVINASESIRDQLGSSSLRKMTNANSLLLAEINDIENFITSNPKGKKLIEYYLALGELLETEHENLLSSTQRLIKNIRIINDIIDEQQAYASNSMFWEDLSLEEIIEDTLSIDAELITKNKLKIEKNYQKVPPVRAQKAKLVHILINLLRNSHEALIENERNNKMITISLAQDNGNVLLKFSDNGHGIEEDNMEKIFNHGFTTKQEGHGFGLHSCANYMTEMKGQMWAESKGPGQGATFVLKF